METTCGSRSSARACRATLPESHVSAALPAARPGPVGTDGGLVRAAAAYQPASERSQRPQACRPPLHSALRDGIPQGSSTDVRVEGSSESLTGLTPAGPPGSLGCIAGSCTAYRMGRCTCSCTAGHCTSPPRSVRRCIPAKDHHFSWNCQNTTENVACAES